MTKGPIEQKEQQLYICLGNVDSIAFQERGSSTDKLGSCIAGSILVRLFRAHLHCIQANEQAASLLYPHALSNLYCIYFKHYLLLPSLLFLADGYAEFHFPLKESPAATCILPIHFHVVLSHNAVDLRKLSGKQRNGGKKTKNKAQGAHLLSRGCIL